MDALERRLGYALPASDADARARHAALAQDFGDGTPTGLVAYRSSGRVLVIGPAEAALAAAARLHDSLTPTVLVPRAGAGAPSTAEGAGPGAAQSAQLAGGAQPDASVRRIDAEVTAVSGHLGAFRVRARARGEEVDLAPSLLTAGQPFDIVLDLCDAPWIDAELAPPGYHHAADAPALEAALAAMPELVGEFEKPRYFAYDPSICAHGRSGQVGCTRCLEACPADAIRSLGEHIEVDAHRCQGGGACATACPSGAITYAYPPARDLLRDLYRVLATYDVAGGSAPVLLLHDAEAGRAQLAACAASLPGWLIPCEVEEVGSVGLEAWLGLLAHGVSRILVLAHDGVPMRVRAELERQIAVAEPILDGLGLGAGRVCMVDAQALREGRFERPPAVPAARFAPTGEKRTDLRLAIEHLHDQALAAGRQPPASVALPAGAPFGTLAVDREACTLCMACVSVCPAAALSDGGERPALRFIEWNCVQCGLCEAACPEDAVRPTPRFLFDAEQRARRRVLNEEAPFCCVSCGKPFATQSVIARMRERLSGHWMYQQPAALKRLEMCEDCRVQDMFRDGGGLLDPERRP